MFLVYGVVTAKQKRLCDARVKCRERLWELRISMARRPQAGLLQRRGERSTCSNVLLFFNSPEESNRINRSEKLSTAKHVLRSANHVVANDASLARYR